MVVNLRWLLGSALLYLLRLVQLGVSNPIIISWHNAQLFKYFAPGGDSYIGDQTGLIIITPFGQMHPIADYIHYSAQYTAFFPITEFGNSNQNGWPSI